MKILLILAYTICSISLYGQVLSECGKDNNPILTDNELLFLNQYLTKEQSGGIDLTNKKILFVTGTSGTQLGSKVEYFKDIKEWNQNDSKISTCIIELIEEEKKKAGGYEIIITYWVKIFTKRSKRKILKKAKNRM